MNDEVNDLLNKKSEQETMTPEELKEEIPDGFPTDIPIPEMQWSP